MRLIVIAASWIFWVTVAASVEADAAPDLAAISGKIDNVCAVGSSRTVDCRETVANSSQPFKTVTYRQTVKGPRAVSSPGLVAEYVQPHYVKGDNTCVGRQNTDSAFPLRRAFNGVRPYGANAPWNIPIKNLPRHPQSEQYAEYLWNDSSTNRAERNFNLNFGEYTYPVFNAEDATAEFRVISSSGFGNLNGKKIPFNPLWSQNKGTDGQIIILDPRTGREWNLWQVTVHPMKQEVTISNGNLCPGDYFTNDYRTKSLQCTGSRGAGINYLAMLVRPWEIAKGRVEHALSMPIPGTSGSFFVPPATKLEYPGKEGNIPEGMRFALEVSYKQIDDHIASIKGLSAEKQRFARIILTAMKEYGWFITDTSGGTHLQFEAPESARSQWEALGVLPQQVLGGKTYPRDILDGFITQERIVTIAPSDQY